MTEKNEAIDEINRKYRSSVSRCGCCEALLMPAYFQVNTVVAIDISADGGDDEPVDAIKICDACRRKLCTCGRCSAFDADVAGNGCCRAAFGWPMVLPAGSGVVNWCRDGWQQARPWTMAEVREWLGLEVVE